MKIRIQSDITPNSFTAITWPYYSEQDKQFLIKNAGKEVEVERVNLYFFSTPKGHLIHKYHTVEEV